MRQSILIATIGTLLLSSCFASTNLIETLKTQINSPAHQVVVVQPHIYNVQVQWGGSKAAWNPDGRWAIGGRVAQRITRISAASSDEGKTLGGWIVYSGEGPIGFRAARTVGTTYRVQVQWGGILAGWKLDGDWVIGGRPNQAVTVVDLTGDGTNLTGTMTYKGEGPISVNARRIN